LYVIIYICWCKLIRNALAQEIRLRSIEFLKIERSDLNKNQETYSEPIMVLKVNVPHLCSNRSNHPCALIGLHSRPESEMSNYG
jgi:hypothetical protein